MGLTGNPFTVKHKDRVTEMTRAFLDYMKSLHLQAPEAINPVPVKNNIDSADTDAESDMESSLDIKLTPHGYPILPIVIMDKELSKAMCESLMRAYITQHYCRFITVIQSDPSLMTIRSGHWEEESTGTIRCIETGYTNLCSRVLSPGRVHYQGAQKHTS